MAQDGVLWKIATELFKRFDVIDAFSDKRSLAKEILIDIGNNACIRIDARIRFQQSDEPGPARTRHADRDAWLQNGVSVCDATAILVYKRSI